MNKKRNLLDDLNIKEYGGSGNTPLDIDINKVKKAVNNNINSAYTERNVNIMRSKKKYFIIAAAATLVLGITAFAASGIIKSWYASSSSIPDYKSLPTEQRCIKDIGYAPVLIESFANGYTFADGSIVKNDLRDENEKSIEKFKSVCFRYEKDGDTVNFSQDKYNSETETDGDIIETVNGTDIYCFSYMNKFVPADYKMTEEDKKAEANGELIFSYGSDKAEVKKIQSVSWVIDNTHYSLMQIDGKLSAKDLSEMAKEIISTK